MNDGANAAVLSLKQTVKDAATAIIAEMTDSGSGAADINNLSFELERPKHEGQGDRASNIAMQLAKTLKTPPRKVAEKILAKITAQDSKLIEKVEVAGPGFINLFVTKKWFADVITEVLRQGKSYGAVNLGNKRKVQVEFVSSNPTGPLHIGHGRGAAVGDSVARILEFTGWDVQREYYVNDAGLQIETLGRSAQARYFEICGKPELAPFPENGYKGDYLYDLARDIQKSEGDKFLTMPLEDSLEWFKNYASSVILEDIRQDLLRFGIQFDVWFSEKSLYQNPEGHDFVKEAMNDMKAHGYAYDNDGALWFRSTDFQDDKDRVLIRANGVPTYFASDIAYHRNKFVTRGFERVIDVWGADHHGYIPRMKAGIAAIGQNPDNFDVLLIQLVSLLRDGQPVSMSTRSGEFITLKAVLDEVGVDATRFFFLTRRSDSQLEFDLTLAKQQSSDNPVYYVQYAHARIKSVFREWQEQGGDLASLAYHSDATVPESLFDNNPEARKLADELALFPQIAEAASRDLAPQMITTYALSLAGTFHAFYNTNRILGVAPDEQLGRLKIAEATRIVLAACLNLLGVSAPEHM